MAITPQAIKDQEFQIKFRGYDTVEVKAYLELIAEEFFELLEQVRHQIDEIDAIVEERDGLKQEVALLEDELQSAKGGSDEMKVEVVEQDATVKDLKVKIKNKDAEIAKLKELATESERKSSDYQDVITKNEQSIQIEKERYEKLANRLEDLMQQNEELRKEEIDFKSTLVAAQQFTSDLKQKTEKEANGIISNARAEADKLRDDTHRELASFPAEIERLKALKDKAKSDLEAVLNLCMENLDIFNEKIDDDYGDLYESIKIDQNGLVNGDGLEGISVDFELPGTRVVKQEVFSMKDEVEQEQEDQDKN